MFAGSESVPAESGFVMDALVDCSSWVWIDDEHPDGGIWEQGRRPFAGWPKWLALSRTNLQDRPASAYNI